LNSALYQDSGLVQSLVKRYGSQSIVASIDYKNNNGYYEIYIQDGTTKIDLNLEDYLIYLEKLEVGEIYLNSMDKDGTGFGYDYETIEKFESKIRTPLIIAGGAGNESHFKEGLKYSNVSAVATANLFNFIGDGLPKARKKLIELKENLANWNTD